MNLYKGDITQLEVDAIVNAANSSLLGGGGVDGAIHRAAGKELLEACEKMNGCPTGEARITAGFQLPAKYVIHTVGPIYKPGDADQSIQLRNCYLNSLKLAVQYNCMSIAFPNISTGVYGYPKEEAAEIAIQAVQDFLEEYKGQLEVVFCVFDEENFGVYREVLENEE